MQHGRLPLHNVVIAEIQLSKDAKMIEQVVKALLNAHPEGLREKDKVRSRSLTLHFFLRLAFPSSS